VLIASGTSPTAIDPVHAYEKLLFLKSLFDEGWKSKQIADPSRAKGLQTYPKDFADFASLFSEKAAGYTPGKSRVHTSHITVGCTRVPARTTSKFLRGTKYDPSLKRMQDTTAIQPFAGGWGAAAPSGGAGQLLQMMQMMQQGMAMTASGRSSFRGRQPFRAPQEIDIELDDKFKAHQADSQQSDSQDSSPPHLQAAALHMCTPHQQTSLARQSPTQMWHPAASPTGMRSRAMMPLEDAPNRPGSAADAPPNRGQQVGAMMHADAPPTAAAETAFGHVGIDHMLACAAATQPKKKLKITGKSTAPDAPVHSKPAAAAPAASTSTGKKGKGTATSTAASTSTGKKGKGTSTSTAPLAAGKGKGGTGKGGKGKSGKGKVKGTGASTVSGTARPAMIWVGGKSIKYLHGKILPVPGQDMFRVWTNHPPNLTDTKVKISDFGSRQEAWDFACQKIEDKAT
jgi:hypothetical protein